MKLLRFLSYLKCTIYYVLTLGSDNKQTIYWYLDADFSVHAAIKIHTGSVFSLVKGIIVAFSTKQKVNAIILTNSELIGVDDRISNILWTWRFWEYQVFKVRVNIIYQDNTIKMKLKKMVNPYQEREHNIMILIVFMLQI